MLARSYLPALSALLTALACGACSSDAPTAPATLASRIGHGIPGIWAPVAPLTARAEDRSVLHLPITSFIATQGTFCAPGSCPFVRTPFPLMVTWFDTEGKGAFADYAGLAARYILQASGGSIDVMPEFDGMVTERLLSDGRVEVHVVLRASGALAGAEPEAGAGFVQSALIFGNQYGAVLAGAEPALADVHMEIKFIMAGPLGAPLPDLVQLWFAPEPGQELLQIKFLATATGPLHSLFGVPEGTRGRLMVQQVGIMNTSAPSKATDAFPVEFIKVQPLGNP